MAEGGEFSVDDLIKFKLIVVGDQSTGKSCILNRFVNETFEADYQATIGLDFQSKNITIHDQDVRLILYDTAGQEKFRSLIPMYIREAQIILLIYDVTNKESFDSMPRWFSQVLDVKNNEAVFALIGNKIDLEGERKVSFEEGKRFADEKNLIFQEVSAKSGENFEQLFNGQIFEAIYNKFKYEFDKRERLERGDDEYGGEDNNNGGNGNNGNYGGGNNNYPSGNSNQSGQKNNNNVKLDANTNSNSKKPKKKKKCC